MKSPFVVVKGTLPEVSALSYKEVLTVSAVEEAFVAVNLMPVLSKVSPETPPDSSAGVPFVEVQKGT